jgi:hypothetical protein
MGMKRLRPSQLGTIMLHQLFLSGLIWELRQVTLTATSQAYTGIGGLVDQASANAFAATTGGGRKLEGLYVAPARLLQHHARGRGGAKRARAHREQNDYLSGA